MKAATTEPIKARDVFERDGWLCYLCLGPVLRENKSGRHPHIATLDHIVPVSRGGLHNMANLACAHLTCNRNKGVRHWAETAEIMK